MEKSFKISNQPLNIALLGDHGSGKSTLLSILYFADKQAERDAFYARYMEAIREEGYNPFMFLGIAYHHYKRHDR